MGTTKALIRKIRDEYDIKAASIDVIKDVKRSSFVAKVVAEDGKAYALKSLFIPPERQRFIVATETMLADRGFPLAEPVPTRSGKLYMTYRRAPYVLYHWVHGDSGKLRRLEDLTSIVRVMARFHNASRHLRYSRDIPMYEPLHWEEEYANRIRSMKHWFSEHRKSRKKRDRIIVRELPFFIRCGTAALERLRESGYRDYREGRLDPKTLVHGDLHHKNIIYEDGTGTLIDLEDVRYDAPSKDMLRIFSMYTKNHGFSGAAFRSMMKAYDSFHALSPKIKHLIYIDFLFPHIFERMLRKKKYKKKDEDELKRWIGQEKKKGEYVYRRYFRSNLVNKVGEN